jgi:iron complex outermembrane recepter protein
MILQCNIVAITLFLVPLQTIISYMPKIILFLLISFASLSAFSQQGLQISGVIKSNSGEALAGATVYLHETRQGTTTNEKGEFVLNAVKPGNYHLHISFIGFGNAARDIHLKTENVFVEIILKQSALELSEVLIEASPFKTENKEQSITVDVVDKTFLQRNREITLAKTLEKLPGISSLNTGMGISKPVIRGFSQNRIVFAEHGIKQEGQQWGNDHGLEIDPFSAERIEIIKGPAAIIYGSDAVAGVINVKPPSFLFENKIRGGAIFNYQSNNELYSGSMFSSIDKNRNHFQVRLSAQDFADYRIPAETFIYKGYVLPVYNGRLKNTAGNETAISSAAGLSRNWGLSSIYVSHIKQISGFFPGAFGTPRSHTLLPDENSRNIDLPSQQVEHFKIVSNSNFRIGRNWLETDAAYQINNRSELASPHIHGLGTASSDSIALNLKLHTLSLNTRYHLVKSEKHKSVYGFSAQYQENKKGGYEFLIPEYSGYTTGMFTYQEFTISSKLFVNAGGRVDFSSIQINETRTLLNGNANSGVQLNPYILRNNINFNATAGLSFVPAEAINFKFNTGSSFRLPSAAELAANGIHHGTFRHEKGNPEIDPEQGYHFDFNLTFQKKNYLLKVTPYFNYFSNFIFLTPTGRFSSLPEAGQVYAYGQAEALHYGGEVFSDIHFFENLHFSAGLDVAFAHNLNTSRSLPFMPPISALFEIEFEPADEFLFLQKPFINSNFRISAPQNQVAVNEKTTPGYSLLNLGTGFYVKTGKQRLQVFFSVHNIFNTIYFNHLSRYRVLNLPEPSRNFSFTLSLPLEYKLKD